MSHGLGRGLDRHIDLILHVHVLLHVHALSHVHVLLHDDVLLHVLKSAVGGERIE